MWIVRKSDRIEQLITSLHEQNADLVSDCATLKVVHTFPLKKKLTFDATIEADSDTSRKLLYAKRVFVGWDACVIYEDLNIKVAINALPSSASDRHLFPPTIPVKISSPALNSVTSPNVSLNRPTDSCTNTNKSQHIFHDTFFLLSIRERAQYQSS